MATPKAMASPKPTLILMWVFSAWPFTFTIAEATTEFPTSYNLFFKCYLLLVNN